MEYQDRKKAKRKYKQALVTTVAALTLGLSVGEIFSVTPRAVYAAETSAQNFKIINNTILIASDPDTQAVVSNLIGPSLMDLIKNGNLSTANFTNGLKTAAFGAIAMIPYGGTFISSILGMLWPSEDNSAQIMLEEIMKQVDELVDQKLVDKDLVDLDAGIRALQKTLANYERSVNPYNGEDHSKDTSKNRAELARHDFETLLEKCSKKGFEESELPVFTSVATAYLTFLEFVKINGEGPIFGMDKVTYASYVTNLSGFRNHAKTTDIKGLAEEYKQYIHDTGTSATNKLINKAKSIARQSSRIQPTQSFVDTRSVSGISAYLNDNFKELQRLNSIYNAKSPSAKLNDMMPATNAEVDKARQVLNDFNAVVEKLNIYNKTTLYNGAFYAVSEAISSVLTDTNMESQIKEKFAATEPSVEDLKIIKDEIVSTKVAFSLAEQASKNWIAVSTNQLEEKTISDANRVPLNDFVSELGNYFIDHDCYGLTPASSPRFDGVYANIYKCLTNLEKNKQYKLVVKLRTFGSVAKVKLDFANKQSKEFTLNGDQMQTLELPFTTDNNPTGGNGTIGISVMNQDAVLIQEVGVISL
ncbi:insecticidal delta-endotoxin Cry8Ea1 family protein [Bacillus thuringiensis]|nr:insecticidal delta-endotoxin Cry8Ea1 family protein [Bacillus thuringiensis]